MDTMANLTVAILVAIAIFVTAEFVGNLGWLIACLLGTAGYAGVRYVDFLVRRHRFAEYIAAKHKAEMSKSDGALKNAITKSERPFFKMINGSGSMPGAGDVNEFVKSVHEINRSTFRPVLSIGEKSGPDFTGPDRGSDRKPP
jgi:hypothetical protein